MIFDYLSMLSPGGSSDFANKTGSGKAHSNISPQDVSFALAGVRDPLASKLIHAKYLLDSPTELYKLWWVEVEGVAKEQGWKPRKARPDLFKQLAACALVEYIEPGRAMNLSQRATVLGFKQMQSYTQTWHPRFEYLQGMLSTIEADAAQAFAKRMGRR